MRRRQFLQLLAGFAGGTAFGASPWSAIDVAGIGRALAVAGTGPYGPLRDPDEHGLALPNGFRSRVGARPVPHIVTPRITGA